MMKKLLRNKKGFTFVEIMFVAVITVMVISSILSVWTFTSKSWAIERKRTELRVDIMKALEVMRNDLWLSSLTYASFYPAGNGPYTGISIPVARADDDGFFTLDSDGKIVWDDMVIYHLFTEADGSVTLRRTVIDLGGTIPDRTARFTQLQTALANGDGKGLGSYTTDMDFLKNVETFEISPLAPVVDFYESSSTPVRSGRVVFGWCTLTPGDHTIKFEITGKNDSSSGFAIGIDSIMIEPSGSIRDVEYYNSSFAPGGALTVAGGTVSRVHDLVCANDHYLEYAAGGAGDYIEIVDYYDLWRESSFEYAALNNTTEKFGEEVHVRLDVPEDVDESNAITWSANVQTSEDIVQGTDGYLPGYPIVIRNIVENGYIDNEADLIRVKFRSSTENPLKISAAYITRKDPNTGNEHDGFANQATAGLTESEYHLHQQLFFRDTYDMDGDGSTEDMVEYVYIPPGSEAWSEWSAFPLVLQDSGGNNVDYFVTFSVPDLEDPGDEGSGNDWPAGWAAFDNTLSDCTYWEGGPSEIHSYYATTLNMGVLFKNAAGTPLFADACKHIWAAKNIYMAMMIDSWRKEGTLESQIFDTALTNPAYNTIKWSEYNPDGIGITAKARSSANSTMAGALDWDSIGGSTVSGTGRYLQFRVEFTSVLSWKALAATLSYANYVDDQVANYFVYDFPEDSNNNPYVTEVPSSSWIDDVEIDWPGEERMCAITGYVVRKDDYGQAKVSVDGNDLLKALSIQVKVSTEIQDRTVTQENYLEVTPRNTGR